MTYQQTKPRSDRIEKLADIFGHGAVGVVRIVRRTAVIPQIRDNTPPFVGQRFGDAMPILARA